jgi:hypothetical protein
MSLSDGTHSVAGLITEQIYDKQAIKLNRFDVVRVAEIKKLLSKGGSDGSAKQLVLMIAAPLQVLVGNLEKVLGTPKNINIASDSDTIEQTEIPQPASAATTDKI